MDKRPNLLFSLPLAFAATLAATSDEARAQGFAPRVPAAVGAAPTAAPEAPDAYDNHMPPELGPSSSLWQRQMPDGRRVPLRLRDTSPFYREVAVPRELDVRSIITIRVVERSSMLSEGDVENRKDIEYNAVLQDWIQLVGLKKMIPDPQSLGDPSVKAKLKQLNRAESELETGNRMEFTIAAEVVDIRPNGNLVMEAHKQVQDNDEVWEFSLTGICRKEDIQPNNEVLSTDVASLRIYKRERGHVRDAYRRGWLTKIYDTLNPF